MKELKFFNTYNQITKLFDVTVMTKQQINKLDNNKSFLVLTPKKHIDVVKPPRKSRSKQQTLREILLDIQKDVKELQQ
ncbi:MAG: hypothetical protein MJ195_02825 [Mycoplasmoidaceae bacterium]|nr:hypothetical protein [Mycoplasmoidaceae bacterium]